MSARRKSACLSEYKVLHLHQFNWYPMNTLYYGDNLKILRDYIKDETVDLVYLDPPFNSNRNYNVLFKDESGAEAPSRMIENLRNGGQITMPPSRMTFQQVAKMSSELNEQEPLGFE